jgi:signal transduction histidine kinase
MDISAIILTTILVLLIATIFVLVLNFRSAKSEIKTLNFRLVSTQLIVLTVWMGILAKTLSSETNEDLYLNVALFIAAVLLGTLFIRGVMKEVKTRDMVFNLIDKLETVNDRLRELDVRKSEFVSFASHQLRGPMASIQGYASLMIEGDYGELPDDLKEPTKRILKSSKRLGGLINDFLDVVKIEKGEMEFNIKTIDLIKVIDDVLMQHEVIINRANIKLNKTFNEKDPIKIRADKDKIKQVIGNLLDNATKYTPKGSITMSIAITDNFAILSIRDTGIGIDPQTINDLFKKFARAKNAERIDVMGSGLGLFVAREIMKAQNGEIWAESKGEGKGSTFYVKFPLK